MSNNEYREAQQQAREHGLRARQEARLENATYTAAEVKVLTEAALRLGRKEAQDECAAMLEERAAQFRGMWGSSTSSILLGMAKTIRSMASQPAPDASEPRTDPSMGMDLPPEPQAGSNRLPGGEG